MSPSRGNFIVDLLVEIDLLAEPDKFDPKVKSRRGQEADYPQQQSQRPYWPDLPAPQWRSLELEALPAPPRKPSVRIYALNESGTAGPPSTRIVGRPTLGPPIRRAKPRKTWRNLAVVSISGAIISLAGYESLYLGNKGNEAEASKSARLPESPLMAGSKLAIVAKSSISGVTPATISAPRGASYQAYHGNASGYRATDQTVAQPADHVLPAASIQTHREEVPKAQPGYESLAQMSEDAILVQAANRLQSGDLQGARTAYEAVADRGSVRGAFGLAQTYDPDFPVMRRIRGSKPDPRLARMWYERAAKLGSLEASERLKELKDKLSASDVLRR